MLLDNEGLGEVAVEIIRSTIWRATEVDLTSAIFPDHAWETRVKLGASIGVHNSDYGGSTFGGFVELLDSEKNKWHVFGLTCYHAVEPGNVPPTSKLGKGKLQLCTLSLSFLFFVFSFCALKTNLPTPYLVSILW